MRVSALLAVAARTVTVLSEEVADVSAVDRLSAPRDAAPLKLMFVGDSITHGFEADITWRFSFWQWLKTTHTTFTFVGPYTGVSAPMPAEPPQPPRALELAPYTNDEFPRIDWGYSQQVPADFDAHHFATSGERADRVMDLVQGRVEEYQPDMILVLLGFNDLAWGGAQPEELLGNLKTLLDSARTANPNLKIVVGNVVHEEGSSADLEARTVAYNALLKSTYASWSTGESPLYHADVSGVYGCSRNQGCNSTTDGLHPNDLGAHQIAHAFSKTLVEHFSIGQEPSQIPNTWSERPLVTPTNLKAFSSPMGIGVTWDRPFGMTFFNVRRRTGDEDWIIDFVVESNRTETILSSAGIRYEYQVRSCMHGRCSEWSEEVVSAVSDRSTCSPPENVRIVPTDLGFEVSWSPPKDAAYFNVTQYGISFINRSTNMTLEVGTYNHSASLYGFASGPFSIVDALVDVSLSAWSDPEGGSLWVSALPVKPGTTRAPAAPSQLKVEAINDTSARVAWTGTEHTASYSAYIDGSLSVTNITSTETVVTVKSSKLKELPNICISAVNGNLESKHACLFGPRSIVPAVAVFVVAAVCLAAVLILAPRYKRKIQMRLRGAYSRVHTG